MRSLAVHTRSFRTASALLGTSSPDDTAAAPATALSDEDEPPSPAPATATACSPAAASGLGEAMAPSAGRIDRGGAEPSRDGEGRGSVCAAAAQRKTGDRLGAAWVVVGFEMV